jgi:hypothetical protein
MMTFKHSRHFTDGDPFEEERDRAEKEVASLIKNTEIPPCTGCVNFSTCETGKVACGEFYYFCNKKLPEHKRTREPIPHYYNLLFTDIGIHNV